MLRMNERYVAVAVAKTPRHRGGTGPCTIAARDPASANTSVWTSDAAAHLARLPAGLHRRRRVDARLVHHLRRPSRTRSTCSPTTRCWSACSASCELVPLLFMAFVGGALADYVDRRRLVHLRRGGARGADAACCWSTRCSDSRSCGCSTWSPALTAAIDGLQRPAMDAMIPRLVTPERDPRRQRAQLAAHAGRLSSAGPALAGMLIATVDLAWVYAIDLATFAVVAGLPGLDPGGPAAAGRRPARRCASVVDRPAVRQQPPRTARHLPGRHQRDVLRHAAGALPVRRRPARRPGRARPALRRPGGRLAAGHGHLAAGPAGSTGTAWRWCSRPASGAWHRRRRPVRTRSGWPWSAWSSPAPPT